MYNLVGQIQLQAPSNSQARQTVNQINRQLQGVAVNVRLDANNKQIQQTVGQINNIGKSAKATEKNVDSLGRTFGTATRRFGSVAIVTGLFLGLTRGIKDAISEAIDFQRELVRISQVTGKTIKDLGSLTKEITKLSTTFGVSSGDILKTARVLSQAGIASQDATRALKVLAQTTLAPTFDNIADTTEGAIALLNQFKTEARSTGDEIKFLEDSLGAINEVSKQFAVESSDLITVIRKTGGIFEAAGGSLNELLAVFTSVRATTRESADTIATGFRTIFTRIQRVDTIEQLKELGIVLQDAEGKFVGPLEAIKRLSIGLRSLDPRDFRFNQIVEGLGGFRQIGKVIPLIKEFKVSTEALAAAQAGENSITEDAATAQQALSVRIAKVNEQFKALFRRFTESEGFKEIVDISLALAQALIKVGDSLIPLIPLLTVFAGIKLGRSLTGFSSGLLGRNQGGPIPKFAKGGFVPGSGNRDTVPAMLTPGEFVIKKKSVESIGANNLAQMNAGGSVQKFAKGGTAAEKNAEAFRKKRLREKGPKTARLKDGVVGGLFLQKGAGGTKGIAKNLPKGEELPGLKGVRRIEGNIYTGLLQNKASSELQRSTKDNIEIAINQAAARTMSALEIDPLNIDEKVAASKAVDKLDLSSIEGFIFEGFISALSGSNLSDPGATFDFVNPSNEQKKRLGNIFDPSVSGRLLDAKRTQSSDTVQSGSGSIANKVLAAVKSGQLTSNDFNIVKRNRGGIIPKFASGGSIEDTVPAMLTPGEFVLNKKSAQKIGLNSLEKMNKTGVAGFNKGGAVGNVQKFAGGGNVGVSTSQFPDISSKVLGLGKQLSNAGVNVDKINKILPTFSTALQEGESDFDALTKAVEEAGGAVKDIKASQESAAIAAKKAASTAEESAKKEKELISAKGESLNKSFALAQNFAFLGGTVAATVSQLGIFSSEVEAGLGASISQFTVLVGLLGTVGQALTAFAAKLAASGNAAVAKGGKGLLALAGPIGKVVFIIISLISVLQFFSVSAAKAAENLQKIEKEKVIDPGLKSLEKFLKGSIGNDRKIKDLTNTLDKVGVRVDGQPTSIGTVARNSITNAGEASRENKSAQESFDKGDKDLAFDQLDSSLSKAKKSKRKVELLSRAREASRDRVRDIEGGNAATRFAGAKTVRKDKQFIETSGAIIDSVDASLNETINSLKDTVSSRLGVINKGIIAQVEGGATPEEAFAVYEEEFNKLEKASQQINGLASNGNIVWTQQIEDEFKDYRDGAKGLADSTALVVAAREQEIQAANRLRDALNAVADIQRLIANTESSVATTLGDTTARESSFSGFSGVGNIDKFTDQLEADFAALGGPASEILDRSKTLAEGVKKLDGDFFSELSDSLRLDQEGSGFKKVTANLPDALEKSLNKIIEGKRSSTDGLSLAGQLTDGSFQDSLIKDLIGQEGADLEALIKSIVEANNSYLKSMNSLTKAIIESEGKIRGLEIGGVDQKRTRAEQVATSRGGRFSLAEKERIRRERDAAGGFGGLSVDQLFKRNPSGGGNTGIIGDSRRDGLEAANKAQDLSLSVKDRERESFKATELADTAARATERLKELADQSGRAGDILAEIDFEQSKVKAFTDSLTDFTFATNQGRQDIQRNFSALNTVLATGNIESIPDQFRPVVGQLLDQFANVELAPGLTGSQIKGELNIQTLQNLLGRRLNEQEKNRVRNDSSTEVEQLQRLFNDVRREEIAARTALIDLESARQQTFIDKRQELEYNFFTNLTKILQDNLPSKNNNAAAAGLQVTGSFEFTGDVMLTSDSETRIAEKVRDLIAPQLDASGLPKSLTSQTELPA